MQGASMPCLWLAIRNRHELTRFADAAIVGHFRIRNAKTWSACGRGEAAGQVALAQTREVGGRSGQPCPDDDSRQSAPGGWGSPCVRGSSRDWSRDRSRDRGTIANISESGRLNLARNLLLHWMSRGQSGMFVDGARRLRSSPCQVLGASQGARRRRKGGTGNGGTALVVLRQVQGLGWRSWRGGRLGGPRR